ncbi:SufD family Fe-S cluster assembly protein [Asticcacaulis sp. EMRT-3]|uniref:SufD family Fe-S cluster assembly protein n=1 Tax=Asticcacaulis sp. EMRT-3 TaxID=3040349 RepID=UPI0024AEE1F7|nr:SufD family Fe-S cluster assembly protein [Asticcacaulis sp. EMRT-3]MDI7774815.1 SufD family Fe-S cluster assembly protein [Asticcacaulis sp. EMRT-3]
MPGLDIFDPSSYPTRRDEDWKYSDLSRALRAAPGKPLVVRTLSELDAEAEDFVYFAADEAGFAGLQQAADQAVAGPGRLYIDGNDFGDEDGYLGYQGEGRITLSAGQSLILFEDYTGAFDYAVHTQLRFQLAEGAKLIRVVILDEPESAISIRTSIIDTAPGSVFKQYVFSTGAKFQRFETHVSHAGHGAVVEMNGAYLLKDKRHFDLTTRVTHGQIDGVTAQLIKGLVKDTATGVFQGRILVEKGADGTDARMRHQALILNDGAHIRAKPELEIYADDVQCAHGNTIGALDEEALFFAMSRGIPEAAARAMLTHAFVVPVADQIEDEVLRETVLNFIENASESFHAL